MKGKKDLWFRVGEAMERVLQAVPGCGGALRTPAEGLPERPEAGTQGGKGAEEPGQVRGGRTPPGVAGPGRG
jgi:hypothetical protein